MGKEARKVMTKIAPQIHTTQAQKEAKNARMHNPQINNQDKYAGIPKPYMDIAQGMESQFINHMLDELEKTVHKEKPDSQAEAYYKSLINQERSDIMAKTENGIGLKDMVLDQIYPKYMRRPIANKEALGQYQNVTMHGNNSKLGEANE